jgi:alpha-D-xyloside xylohydrolase
VDLWITTTPGDAVYSAAAPHPFLSLLRQYADAVGHAPPMPAFASGFIHCKDRYNKQSQLLDVARGYINRSIPISMITIDWFHWQHLGDMSLNPACWPDPQGMVDELRSLGIELMTTHWPFMSADSVHRAEYEAAGALAVNGSSGAADTFWAYLQEGALITTLSEQTRNLTMQKWIDGYGRFGIKAMWLDETEPDRTGPSNDLLVAGGWQYEGVSNTELGPTWRQQWLRTMTDTLRLLHGEGNYFLLSRSAWLGTAKYGHAVWSGDTSSDWEDFALQIPTALGAGLSGIGLWTSDLGGYSATMQPFDPKLEELLVRWAQFAQVSPLMRLHGHRAGGPPSDPVCMQTNGDNEPWTLFKQQANYDAFVAAIRWREQHRNYVMDAQTDWAESGAPMLSPTWLLFPGDPVCAFRIADDGSCSDAFMFGTDFLAKPVTQYQLASSWVWLPRLPAGQTWTNVFTGENLGNGFTNVTVATPISSFPLFQRTYAA